MSGLDQYSPEEAKTPSSAEARLSPLPSQFDERQRAIYERIATGPRGTVRGPLGLMLHSPDVAEHAQALGAAVRYASVFPASLSEFVIAMVARHYDCDYEWSVHAPIARQAGVSTSVLEAIGRGLMPNFDNDEQADIYRYTDALLNMHDIGDEAFFAVKARFGERGIVDLAAIVGYYGLVAGLLNSVRAEPLGERLPPRQK